MGILEGEDSNNCSVRSSPGGPDWKAGMGGREGWRLDGRTGYMLLLFAGYIETWSGRAAHIFQACPPILALLMFGGTEGKQSDISHLHCERSRSRLGSNLIVH